MMTIRLKKALSWTVLFFLGGLLADHAGAQRVLKKRFNATEVVHVATAPGRITVIDLPEPPQMVMAGDTTGFKIEAVENKVIIQPLEPKAATNLLVWTAAGRLTFDLATRADDDQVNYVLDYSSDPPLREAAEPPRKDPDRLREQILSEERGKLVASLLASAYPVPHKWRPRKRPVVYFQNVIHMDDLTYIRYVLINKSPQPFTIQEPHLSAGIIGVDRPVILPGYGVQTGDGKLRKLRLRDAPSPTLIEHRVQKPYLLPRESTNGVLVMARPSKPLGPWVLSATFPGFKNGQAGASVLIN